jgi:muramoyltetrapeptide carboxypeptidase
MKKTAKQSAGVHPRQAIFAPSIHKGDTIGLVAPAGSIIHKDNFTEGLRILEKNGFRVKYNRDLLNARGYLAGSDEERAVEFNELWSEPEIKALVAARGGYGCMRMIDLIDMTIIRQNPKILIGFSDLTVLLAAIYKKTGLVTYHGPVVTTLASINKQSQTSFFNVLQGKAPVLIKSSRIKILKKGTAKGLLLGGNLTTLSHMIGTPYEFAWDNAILFMEDIGETPYRLDRFLTHLDRANRLQKIQGLILGSFTDDNRKKNRAMQRTVYKRVAELLQKTDIPVWANFPVGHAKQNLTLPLGAEVEMDSSEHMLKFL